MTLTTKDDHVFVVNNVHIVDGSEERKIPGKDKEARDRFKQTAVRYVLQETERLYTPAATRGMITLGDFNMDYDCGQETI